MDKEALDQYITKKINSPRALALKSLNKEILLVANAYKLAANPLNISGISHNR